MSLTGAVLLQLALDVPSTARALEIAEAVYPHFDIAGDRHAPRDRGRPETAGNVSSGAFRTSSSWLT